MKGIFIICIILIVSQVEANFKCPDKTHLNDCVCDAEDMSIICDNIQEVPDFEQLDGYTFNLIIIKNSGATKIPLSTAVTKELKLIDNDNLTDFDSIFSFKPTSLTLIKNKYFTRQVFEKILQEEFSDDLEELHIEEYFNLGELTVPFDNFKNLKRLSLRNTGLKVINPVFTMLSKLEFLDLSYNQIYYLYFNSLLFPNHNSTFTINLKYNKITSFGLRQSGISSNSVKINLDLSNNNIEDLDKDPFYTLCSNQNEVHLGGNELKCAYYNVTWIFNRKFCKDYLKNAICKNNHRNLFDLSENDFSDRTTHLTRSTTITRPSTKLTTKTTTIITTASTGTTINPKLPKLNITIRSIEFDKSTEFGYLQVCLDALPGLPSNPDCKMSTIKPSSSDKKTYNWEKSPIMFVNVNESNHIVFKILNSSNKYYGGCGTDTIADLNKKWGKDYQDHFPQLLNENFTAPIGYLHFDYHYYLN